MSKIIFLDQFCEISPYLPRSTLDAYVPYSIIRSIYSQYYGSSSPAPLALLSDSPRHSPAVSLAHSSPAMRHPRGDSIPQSNSYDSGYFKPSSSHAQDQLYDTESGSIENKARNIRSSGPLEYSATRKLKHVDSSTSASTGPSPLPRFAMSRSGPISYK